MEVFNSKFCNKVTHSSKHFQKEFHTAAPHISLSLFMQPVWKKSKYDSLLNGSGMMPTEQAAMPAG